MAKPDPSAVLLARSADRIALIVMREDSAAALELCKDLHEHRAEVHVAMRYDTTSAARDVRAIPARYPGRCAVCAAGVSVGDPIVCADGRVSHARCAP